MVYVRGALMHHPDGCGDCYDAVQARWAAACAEPGSDVVLSVSSPGGLVNGLFDTVRDMRAAAAAAGKRVHVHIESAASAGYALCMVADRGNVWASDTATVGSIGTTSELRDESRAISSMGVDVVVLVSGARKADTNPAAPLTDDAVAAQQQIINDLADSFFSFVGEQRGMSPDALRALEASVMVSSRAVAAGLVDRVGSLTDLIASIKNPTAIGAPAPSGENTDMKFQSLIESLRAAAEGDNELESKAAKKMLAALDDGEKSDDEAPPPSEQKPAEGANADASAAAPAAAASVAANAGGVNLMAIVEAQGKELAAIKAQQAKRDLVDQVNTLLASRPDFDADTIKRLRTENLATVKFAVENFPKGLGVGNVAAALAGTNGAAVPTAGVNGLVPTIDPVEDARMSAAMGAGPVLARQVYKEGNALVLGGLRPQAVK